jgi:hypothetical protein
VVRAMNPWAVKVAQKVPLASVAMRSNSPRSRLQGRLQIAILLPLTQQEGPVSRAFLGGRTWDRTRDPACEAVSGVSARPKYPSLLGAKTPANRHL